MLRVCPAGSTSSCSPRSQASLRCPMSGFASSQRQRHQPRSPAARACASHSPAGRIFPGFPLKTAPRSSVVRAGSHDHLDQSLPKWSRIGTTDQPIIRSCERGQGCSRERTSWLPTARTSRTGVQSKECSRSPHAHPGQLWAAL